MQHENKNLINNIEQPKDRLITKMIYVLSATMWTVATFNLITGGIAGIQADMLRDEIENLEKLKSTISVHQLPEIEASINQLTNEINQKVGFLIPSVYSFLATGSVGFAANTYLDWKNNKKAKKSQNKSENKSENIR